MLNKRNFVIVAQSLFHQIIFLINILKVNIKKLQTFSRHRILKHRKMILK